ncbi:hypothetical protein QQS21_000344 [Conoideocrella luteorostrata]|uniref:Neutral protease 2 n=1 Tax=Conoideocrella luteorostrata TaxID=1105319 RepID=A0AAJ0G2M2_9HYPO|nr:hypothetical protein QQS21_000344 [Conoideocrella luteorostrata]
MRYFSILAALTLMRAAAGGLISKRSIRPPNKSEQKEVRRTCLVNGSMPLFRPTILGKRNLDQSCSNYPERIRTAYTDCAARARAGAAAASSGSSDLMQAVFKTEDTNTRNRVARQLKQIADECSKRGDGITPVSCGPNLCQAKTSAAETLMNKDGQPGVDPIALCDIKEADRSCDGQDIGDMLLHEMSHSWGKTDDKGYGMENIQNLETSVSLDNADSYTRFAKAVHLKCKVQDMQRGGSSPGGQEPTEEGEEPTQEGEEPTQEGEEPTQEGEEPTQEGEEPTQEGEEPTQEGEEPTQQGEWPTQQGEWPTQQGEWPTQQGEWPTQQGEWPTQQGEWPTQQGEWPTQQGEWPAQQGEWSAQQGEWPTQQGEWPTQQGE